MSRWKAALLAFALFLGGQALRADDAVDQQFTDPTSTQIVIAVLHLPGPGEAPLYGGIQFAKAPTAQDRERVWPALCDLSAPRAPRCTSST